MGDISNEVVNGRQKNMKKNLTIVIIISLAVFLSVLSIFQTKYIYFATAQQAFSETPIQNIWPKMNFV